jgi:hypothetical protein
MVLSIGAGHDRRGGNVGAWYQPVYHCCTSADYHGREFKSSVLRGFSEEHRAPEVVVTPRGGNSYFTADSSEVPRLCLPHTISAREDPRFIVR